MRRAWAALCLTRGEQFPAAEYRIHAVSVVCLWATFGGLPAVPGCLGYGVGPARPPGLFCTCHLVHRDRSRWSCYVCVGGDSLGCCFCFGKSVREWPPASRAYSGFGGNPRLAGSHNTRSRAAPYVCRISSSVRCHDFLPNQNPSCKISIFSSVFQFSFPSKYSKSNENRQNTLPVCFPTSNVMFARWTSFPPFLLFVPQSCFFIWIEP